jgi:hypothetical protein
MGNSMSQTLEAMHKLGLRVVNEAGGGGLHTYTFDDREVGLLAFAMGVAIGSLHTQEQQAKEEHVEF